MGDRVPAPDVMLDSLDEASGGPEKLKLLILAVLVFAAIALLARLQLSIEAASANMVRLLPVGFAFAAGMVASVNPCGFMLLPAYISYQLGVEERKSERRSASRRLLRSLATGGVATIGFLLIFGLIGGLVALGGQWVIRVFPHAGAVVGVVLAILGGWLLFGDLDITVLAASRLTVKRERGLRNVFLFGVVYAIGSLSCTLPIFLAVVGTSLAGGGIVGALAPFIGFGLGMGLVLMAVTVSSAFLRSALVRRLKGLVPWVNSAGALFLIGAGAYLVYYWLVFARPLV